MLKDGDVMGVFRKLGMNPQTNLKDGTITLNNGYSAQISGMSYTLFDLGISEDFIMKNVSEIYGNVNLNGSALKFIPKLRKVHGSISFYDCKLSDLRSLEDINGSKITWILR